MNRDTLHGFVPATVTPFSHTGEIVWEAFAEVLDFLVGRGASAICVAGDNGESWALSAVERGQLVRFAKDRLGDAVPVILGISAPTMDAVTGYIRAAQENGADALLSMPQTYVLKASDEEVMHRFARVSAATDLPVILYNSPRRAGMSLTVDQIARLCDAGNVIGLKESQRDFFHHSHLLDRLAERLSVMTGPSHYILPNFGLGARGFIATGPELISARPSDLAAIARTPGSAAYRTAHRELTTIYETLMRIGTWPSALKAALELIGVPAGVPRDPVLRLGDKDTDALRAMLDGLGRARG
ncbi:dihydrodipicolinate synthase family protein [Rhodobacteraceae bacterium CCMM004]|nr:dihydrodipicolinate synthase family protein [Rhodobacteraceae bacterium CCMM004]